MRAVPGLAARIAVCAGLWCGLALTQDGGVSVITNVYLVTMDAPTAIEGKAVVVEAGKVREILDAEVAARLSGVRVIDGGGHYLTPGLIDAHVHHRPDLDYINYIAHGVTTVIGLGQGSSAPAFRRLRDEISSGEIVGPRIYTTAQTIANHIQIDTEEAAREFVRGLEAEGYDLIKVYNNIPRDVFDAVVDEGSRVGLSVFGHLPRNFPVEYSLANGLDVVAHVEEFYFTYFGGPRDQQLEGFDGSSLPDLDRAGAVIDLMVEHEVALIPNLIYSFTQMKFWENEEAVLADPELRYSHPDLREYWRGFNGARRPGIGKRMLRERIKYGLSHELTRRAHVAGVLIVTGTDAPVRGVVPGASLHGELRELVKAGLGYRDALAAATRNAGRLVAKYVDKEARVGVIAPGHDADLILVAADPLSDIRNMARIEGVMVDGAWFDEATLARLRSELAERYAK